MSAAAPLDREAMRRHNLGLVLRAVADGDRLSSTDVALATGLHKATVSSLVADLIDRELVREAGTAPDGTVGRPAVALALAGDRYVALGLEINADHLTYTAVDLLGRVRDRGAARQDNRARPTAQTLDALAELIAVPRRRLTEAGSIVVGATLALPGLVDPHGERSWSPRTSAGGTSLWSTSCALHSAPRTSRFGSTTKRTWPRSPNAGTAQAGPTATSCTSRATSGSGPAS